MALATGVGQHLRQLDSSEADGSALVGHHDRQGGGANPNSWNSAHPSKGCSQANLVATGGAGLLLLLRGEVGRLRCLRCLKCLECRVHVGTQHLAPEAPRHPRHPRRPYSVSHMR